MDSGTLMWGMLFGCVGMGYFSYGKKQKQIVPFACGIVLMAYPYFITNNFLVVAVGAIVMAIPYFLRF